VRAREKADVAGESGVVHWHQPNLSSNLVVVAPRLNN
jgi:hypothetical protein